MGEWLEWFNPLDGIFEADQLFPPLENALSTIPVIGDPFKDTQKDLLGKIINWKTGLIVGGLIYAGLKYVKYRGGANRK